MAMLMTNEVFARTWGERAGPAPQAEYWPALIGARQGRAPGLPVHRRGVLGHGVDAAAAGLRLLLRQAPLRPAGARGRRVGARAPAGRRGLPGAPAALHREPRRAARGGHLRARAGAGGRGRDVDAAGRAPLPRRPARGPAHAHPGLPRPRARTSRPTTTCARSTRGCCAPSHDADLRDGDWRLCECDGWPDNDSCRQLVAWCWSSAGSRHLVVVNLSDAPAQAQRAPALGRPRGAATWELTDRLGRARASSAPATSSPPTACTSPSTPGRRTSSPSSADGPTPSTPRPSRRARSSAARPPHASVLGTPERAGPRRSGSGAGRHECGALTAPGRPPRGA